MPRITSGRHGFKGSIAFGLILMAVGALPVVIMLAAEGFLSPQDYPSFLIGIVAIGYGAVFLGAIVLALRISPWLFGSGRES